MKGNINTALGLLILLLSPPSVRADGINAILSLERRHRIIETIPAPIPIERSFSGTNTGGGHRGVEFEVKWCRDSLGVIRKHQRAAKLLVNSTLNYYEASRILHDGLVDALRNGNYSSTYQSHMRRAIEEGRQLAVIWRYDDVEKTTKERKILYQLLDSYYDFLKHTAHKLDFPILNSFHCQHCTFNIDLAEKRFVKFATQYLRWITKNLIEPSLTIGNKEVSYISKGYFYFGGLAHLSRVVALELETSIWRQSLACSIDRLWDLHESASAFHSGDRSEFPAGTPGESNRLAVNWFNKDVETILNEILNVDHCGQLY